MMNDLKSFIVVLLFALVGLSCWLYEVINMIGWYDIGWIYNMRLSPFAGASLAAMSFITPFSKQKKYSIRKLLAIFLLLLVMCLVCYEIGKWICYSLFCRHCLWSPVEFLLLIILGVVLHIFSGTVIWLITRKWIGCIKVKALFYIIFFLLLIVPMSIITIQLIPGLGHQNGWVDTVKMGYPVFYSITVMGISGLFLNKLTSPLRE